MTFDPNIPNAGDKLSNSQPVLKSNNISLNSQFGTEHDALNGGAGKHKFVTLQQNAPRPACAGADLQFTKTLIGNTWYVELYDSGGRIWYVPLRRTITGIVVNVGAGTHQTNLVDFNTLGFSSPAGLAARVAGTVMVFDENTTNRTIFCPFVYIHPNLAVPGQTGQLSASGIGGTFERFVGSGTTLQLQTNGAINTKATLIIVESIV